MTTKDYTAAVIRLEQAYESMQLARKRAALEVKSEYKARIRDEIARRQKAAEIAFAQELAIEHAAGMPGNVIRENVLHTQDWNRWKKWRDLAEIEPERVTVTNAKKARELENAVFLWSEDYQTLTVKKNSKGISLDPAVIYDMGNLKKMGSYWMADTEDDDYELAVRKADESYAFLKMVTAEIQRAIDAGLLDNPEHKD